MDYRFLHPWLDEDRQRICPRQAISEYNVLLNHYFAPPLKPDRMIKANRRIERSTSITCKHLHAKLHLAQPRSKPILDPKREKE
jgi:hypothetical protein